MKKIKLFLAFALSAAMLLSGCGQGNFGEVLSPEDFVQPSSSVTSSSSEPESSVEPSQEPDEPMDLPPEEGMVQSSLTGLWVDEEVAASRPIAVMFPTDKGSQPQYGIGLAGVLYECMEEGNISRQMGIIEDWQDLEKIGNIRSGRDYYGYWSMEWDAYFVCWGGPFYLVTMTSRPEFEYLAAVRIGVNDLNSPALGAGAFWRPKGEQATIHNGFTDGESLSRYIKSLGYDKEHREEYWDPNHFLFASVSNPNTLEDAADSFAATEIDLDEIFPFTSSYLEYNEEDGLYYKYLHGNKQIDVLTDEQLTFKNVIVQNTDWEYQIDGKYLKFNCVDDTQDGYYFTNGKGIHITWKKESDYAPTRYYDDAGNEINLNPGKTYIAVAQKGRDVSYN